MRTFKKCIRALWFGLWGRLLGIITYDRKYLRGKWFNNRYYGFGAIGWEWVTYDALSKLGTGDNMGARFPIAHGCRVIFPENIEFDPDDLNNFQSFGIYYQAFEKITIGKGTFIGPNVGLITANHDPDDLNKHQKAEPIVLGEKCWIGMNSVVLPGVTLGANTIVGAGSVVTESYPDGNCVIAGNPARLLHHLEPQKEK